MRRSAPALSAGSAPGLDGLRVLPWASCGEDVIPGIPRRVHELADELAGVARGLRLMRDLVAEVPRLDWSGTAAALCGVALHQQPTRYADGARAMAEAAASVRAHASALELAQRTADDAVRLDVAAATATRHWLSSAGPEERRVVGAASDPGTPLRRRVQLEVEDARHRVAVSAAGAAQCLRDGARRAPDRPGFARRAVRSVSAFGRDLNQGAVESAFQTVDLALRLQPAQALLNPGGYWSGLEDLGEASAHAVAHPVELAKALADVETLRESPGRWAGHLLPDVALAVGTAGALPVAERSATVAARTAARVGPARIRVPLKDALALQSGTGRGPLRLRDVRAFASAPDRAGYVTRLSPVDAAVSRRVARDSAWAEAHLTPRLQEVAHDVAARLPASDRSQVALQGLNHAVKDQQSLARKLASDAARTGHSLPELAPAVNDTVRYTLTVPPDHYVASSVAAARAMEDRGMTLAAVKNFWGGDRYQGLNLTFADPVTGRPLELQLHTPDSWEATVDTHPDFEMFRSDGVDAVLKEFYRQRIADRFSTVTMPPGAASLSAHLVASGGSVRMVVPGLRSLPDVERGLQLSTGVAAGRSLAWGDDD